MICFLCIIVLAGFVCKPVSALDVELTLGTESAFNVVRGTSTSTGTTLFYVGTSTVGVGTTTPSSMLTVEGTATVTGNLAVGTSTLFVDLANNRVGIGTTIPSAAITVNGAFLRAGSTMIGSNSNTHVNLGVTSTTGSTTSDYSYATVGGGKNNNASYSYATVGGGVYNTASGLYATVGGGSSNTASGANATVEGGFMNTALGDYATVGGGRYNVAGGDYSWAGGCRMKLSSNAHRTFVWGYETQTSYIDTADAFLIFPNYTGATGKVGIGTSTPTRKLFVNGDAGGTSAWNNDSDERLKKNIMPIKRALEKVTGLQGVQFEWRDTTNHEEGIRIGFIAQQVKDVLPEVVDKKGEYYSMQYAPITALLVEAIKEMKAENDALKARISALEQCRVGIAHQTMK
jgi:hypothetical protein